MLSCVLLCNLTQVINYICRPKQLLPLTFRFIFYLITLLVTSTSQYFGHFSKLLTQRTQHQCMWGKLLWHKIQSVTTSFKLSFFNLSSSPNTLLQ